MWWDSPRAGIPLILLLGTALGVAYNASSSRPVPWIAQPKTAVNLEELEASGPGSGGEAAGGEADYLGIPPSEFPITISMEKAKELYDSGNVLVLDSRDEDEYAEGHIAGAVHAPYDVVGADPVWLEDTAAETKVIIVYCGGGDCELSMNLAFAISQAGHRHVTMFEEGYPAWKEAGHPTRMGANP